MQTLTAALLASFSSYRDRLSIRRTRTVDWFRKMDTSGDGKVSRAEPRLQALKPQTNPGPSCCSELYAFLPTQLCTSEKLVSIASS